MDERYYWYWLLNCEGAYSAKIGTLLADYGSPYEIFKQARLIDTSEVFEEKLCYNREHFSDMCREYDEMLGRGVQMLLRTDENFPQKLLGIDDAPYGLFVKGSLPDGKLPSVAIIGARKCTVHGRWIASKLGYDLAQQGIVVVSGMAEGIDGASHIGALDAGGKTIAVLGSGIDVVFPKSHEGLYNRLVEHGTVFSEYGPGMQGLSYHFPQRNRIISGLADVVIVVEAREKSGSLITVAKALEQGREVMAVPGRPDDLASVSCNRLIREGAGICSCIEDVLVTLELSQSRTGSVLDNAFTSIAAETKKLTPKKVAQVNSGRYSEGKVELTEDERRVYGLITGTPRHMDELLVESELSYPELISILLTLELRSLIKTVSAGTYQRR